MQWIEPSQFEGNSGRRIEKPPRGRVAVIYDGRDNSYFFGWVGDHGFRHQGEELVRRLSKNNAVEAYPFTSIEDFIESWNGLDGAYSRIYIIAHGTEAALHCAGKSIGKDRSYDFSILRPADVAIINLFCCNGATVNSEGVSTAIIFADLTGAMVGAVHNGKLNFSWYGCYPEPAEGGTWFVVH